MKRTILFFAIFTFVISCQSPEKEPEKTEATVAPAETPAASSSITMPYTATYSSNFTSDVPEEDVKKVLDSYVAWEKGDFKALSSAMGDSIYFNNGAGIPKFISNADLMKMWQTSRDSLSNVTIRMTAWQKSKSDKGHKLIMTWYDEIDTYKTGKVDSMNYHDINIVDSLGRIVWYSQFRKPKHD